MTRNEADDEESIGIGGGGIYATKDDFSGQPVQFAIAAPTIINNVIEANAARKGAGIFWANDFPVIANNVVAFNAWGLQQWNVGSNAPVIRYNNVYGNSVQETDADYDGIADATGTNGNISAGPLLPNRRNLGCPRPARLAVHRRRQRIRRRSGLERHGRPGEGPGRGRGHRRGRVRRPPLERAHPRHLCPRGWRRHRRAMERGYEGAQFFAHGLRHFWRDGTHIPGKTNLWQEFKNRPASLDEKLERERKKAGMTGIGTPAQLIENFRALEDAGVDTVPELAQRAPANLLAKMETANEQKTLVRRLPVLSQVESWVEQAKSLPRVITY